MKSVIKCLSSEVLIVGGGTLFSHFSGRGIPFMLLVAILRKIIQKRVYFYGIGYSSTTSKNLESLAKIAFKMADRVYVRDSLSRQILTRRLGVKTVGIIPDLGFCLKKKEAPDRFVEIKRKKNGPLVGISLLYTWSEHDNTMLDSITAFTRYLCYKYNATICFLTFNPALIDNKGIRKSDEQAGMAILSRLPDEIKKSVHVLPHYNPGTTLKIVSELDAVISMRYHCLVFALKENIPYIAISFEDKYKAFAADYGGAIIELERISQEHLIKEWEKIKLNTKK